MISENLENPAERFNVGRGEVTSKSVLAEGDFEIEVIPQLLGLRESFGKLREENKWIRD